MVFRGIPTNGVNLLTLPFEVGEGIELSGVVVA